MQVTKSFIKASRSYSTLYPIQTILPLAATLDSLLRGVG